MAAERAPILNKDTLISNATSALEGEGVKLSKKEVTAVYDQLLAGIRQGLMEGNDVRLAGIGSLRTKMTAERNGRNVRTGEAIVIAARREVKFSVASDLKADVAAVK